MTDAISSEEALDLSHKYSPTRRLLLGNGSSIACRRRGSILKAV